MVVCVCNAVNEHRINEAVEAGVKSIKQLCAETRAGTCCGKCLPEAKRVLDQAVLARATNALQGLESAA